MNGAPARFRHYRRARLAILAYGLSLGIASAVFAQTPGPALTLEQAISQIQQQTGGKVLSAQTIGRGRSGFEHRIRVLEPNGHVRVISVISEAAKPVAAPTNGNPTKNPALTGDGNKEKH